MGICLYSSCVPGSRSIRLSKWILARLSEYGDTRGCWFGMSREVHEGSSEGGEYCSCDDVGVSSATGCEDVYEGLGGTYR